MLKKVICFFSAFLLSLSAFGAGEGERAKFSDYYTQAAAEPAVPEFDGFIRRWTLLEPIAKSFSSNAMLTDNFLSEVMAEEYFKASILPEVMVKVVPLTI